MDRQTLILFTGSSWTDKQVLPLFTGCDWIATGTHFIYRRCMDYTVELFHGYVMLSHYHTGLSAFFTYCSLKWNFSCWTANFSFFSTLQFPTKTGKTCSFILRKKFWFMPMLHTQQRKFFLATICISFCDYRPHPKDGGRYCFQFVSPHLDVGGAGGVPQVWLVEGVPSPSHVWMVGGGGTRSGW